MPLNNPISNSDLIEEGDLNLFHTPERVNTLIDVKIGQLAEVDANAELIAARNGMPTLGSNLNLNDDIKGTTQTITFNTDGTVQKIQHKNVSDVVLREDVFTYAANLITEVRTLSTAETITFKYHTDTLLTEVI